MTSSGAVTVLDQPVLACDETTGDGADKSDQLQKKDGKSAAAPSTMMMAWKLAELTIAQQST